MVGEKVHFGSHYTIRVFDMLYLTSFGSWRKHTILYKVMGKFMLHVYSV